MKAARISALQSVSSCSAKQTSLDHDPMLRQGCVLPLNVQSQCARWRHVLRCMVHSTTCSALVKLQQQEVRYRRGAGPCAEAADGRGPVEEARGRGRDLAAALQTFLRGLLPASRHFTDELLGATLQLLLSAPVALLQPRVGHRPCHLTRCLGAGSENACGLMGACYVSTGFLFRARERVLPERKSTRLLLLKGESGGGHAMSPAFQAHILTLALV